MTKPTKEQMNARAWGMAEAHFYCDDECEIAWEPFEHWDNEELQSEVSGLAASIFMAMLWAQGDGDESV
jgi:hypothetical protein